MTDYLRTGNLDERDMNPDYRQAEKTFREKARTLWTTNEEIKRSVRSKLDLTPEERQDEYMKLYKQKVEGPFEQQASDFVGEIMGPRGEDERVLTQGVGDSFPDHLCALSGKPVEELPGLMKTAKRTGQQDLARAVAQVALDRNQFALFNEWAEGEPELAEALKRIRTTPDTEQLVTRTKAVRPHAADANSLEPTAEDHQKAAQKHAADEASRAAFFNRPRSIVGRHSRPI